MQSPRCRTWQNYKASSVKYFIFPELGLYCATINSQLTCKQSPQQLLSLFQHTKPPYHLPPVLMAMTASQDPVQSTPQLAHFNTDSKKFLINSGASVHMWNK